MDTSLLTDRLPRPRDEIRRGSERVWSILRSKFEDPYFAPLMAESLKGEFNMAGLDSVCHARY